MENIILKLHKEGKSYNAISKITGKSKGTIAYHCSPTVKKNYHKRKTLNKKAKMIKVKLDAGGKCVICQYSKCLSALEFHHTNPEKKEFGISYMVSRFSIEKMLEEIKKCILVCANCHREIHAGLHHNIQSATPIGFKPI